MNSNRIGPPGPPSEPQRGAGSADSKKFREELQKIQEVKAVDPDEQSRQKNKFLAMQLGDDDTPDNLQRSPSLAASPFDVNFQQDLKTASTQNLHASPKNPGKNKISTQKEPFPSSRSRTTQASYSDKNTPIPSPAYSPAPTTNEMYSSSPQQSTGSSSLPSSQQFWGTVDLPDTPPSQNIRETSSSQNQSFSNQSNYNSSQIDRNQSNNNSDDEDNEDEDTTVDTKNAIPISSEISQKSKTKNNANQNLNLTQHTAESAIQSKKNKTPPSHVLNSTQKESSLSPFDLAAKTNNIIKTTIDSFLEEQSAFQNFVPNASMPDQNLQAKSQEPLPLTPLVDPEAEMNLPLGSNPSPQKTPTPSFQEQSGTLPSSSTNKSHSSIRPVMSTDESTTRGNNSKQQTMDHVSTTILQPSTPQFSPDIQPLAQAATTQAAPYLTAETMALFYQMVGTIYVMTTPTGISRTEVTLNTPAFANSKFFGSTITIEKYATAPDSLNIRLTGSNDAVQTFNQNISSLVAAFENGKFAFRIGRIEASYQAHQANKPVYRRKEKNDGNDSTPKDK